MHIKTNLIMRYLGVSILILFSILARGQNFSITAAPFNTRILSKGFNYGGEVEIFYNLKNTATGIGVDYDYRNDGKIESIITGFVAAREYLTKTALRPFVLGAVGINMVDFRDATEIDDNKKLFFRLGAGLDYGVSKKIKMFATFRYNNYSMPSYRIRSGPVVPKESVGTFDNTIGMMISF